MTMRYDELADLIERIITENIHYDAHDTGESDVHTMVTEIVELVKANFIETS